MARFLDDYKPNRTTASGTAGTTGADKRRSALQLALSAAVSGATGGVLKGGAAAAGAGTSGKTKSTGTKSGGTASAASGESTYSGGITDLSDYLRRQQAAATEAALAKLKGAYEKNAQLYDAQREQLPALYAQQRNQLAAETAQSQRSFDERALASGLNTGASGQAALARSSVMQQGMANIGRAEADALAEIELAKNQLRAEYENAVAQQEAQDSASLMERLYEEAVRQQNARLAAAKTAASGAGASETAGAEGTSSLVQALQNAFSSRTSSAGNTYRTGSAGGNQLVSVPGYGQISYDDAEMLEQRGLIKLRGVDSAGNPVYTKTATAATGPLALSR